MKFDRKLYKKKYFLKAVSEVKKDYHKDQIKVKETDDAFFISQNEDAILVADYYIYIYNENN